MTLTRTRSVKVSTPNLSYGDKDIQTLSDFDWIKLRPTNHIPDTHIDGQHHIIKEIFDNSLDETELFPNGEVDVLLCLDKVKNTYQVIISDNGRGVPLGKLVESFTCLKTSGKYDKASYAGLSGGLNGVGGKVAVALSKNFKVITVRDNQIGHLVFKDANLVHESIVGFPSHETGTVVALEPDPECFTGIDQYIEFGYTKLTQLALLLSMFSKNTHIVIRTIGHSIDPKFWTMNGAESINFLRQKYTDTAAIIVDGHDKQTTMHHLRELWDVQSKFIWMLEDISFNNSWIQDGEQVILSCDINMYLPKIIRSLQVSSLVNNIPMKDLSSSHVTVILNVLKKVLSVFIEDPEVKSYFMDIYKLPLCFAVSIKYSDVQFTSLAKDGFKNKKFEEFFEPIVMKLLNQFDNENSSFWKILYDQLHTDIVQRYLLYYNKPLTTKAVAKKISLELHDRQFYNCNTPNRQDAELFIVEGVSASHVRMARDPFTQAVFMIRGKPLNVHRTDKNRTDPMSRIKSFPAYEDLMRILNVQPGQTDLSTCNYGKIILMQDADVDGGHIRALHIGALLEINPRILESGMVYLANPPLYEVSLDPKSEKKKFIRSKRDLIKFRIECVYQPVLQLALTDVHGKTEIKALQNSDYVTFCEIVVALGEMFEDLSKQLVIPVTVLEKLSHVTGYIQPGKVDVPKLREMFGVGTYYNTLTNILTIADGENEISFSLAGVTEALYAQLIPILYKLNWKSLKILVTTKLTNALQNTHVSICQLYQMFTKLNDRLHVLRHKGLGGVAKEDLRPTCMDPNTRILHQITNTGDVERILALLGDDATVRRQILDDCNLLSD